MGEREFFIVFIGRIQSDPDAATPLGLYNVTPSFLLTVASLSVSYMSLFYSNPNKVT